MTLKSAYSSNLSHNTSNSLPQPPVFDELSDEREHRKISLVKSLRIFGKLKYNTDIAGHFAVRDPEHTKWIWVNPMMVPLDALAIEDLILIDDEGNVRDGRHPVNLGAYVLHSRIHEHRKDIIASVHFHSKYGKIWSSLGRLLDPISQDSCALFGKHGIYDVYSGVPQKTQEGDRVAEALGDNLGLILQNHGLLTVGRTVEAAAWRYIAMERACEAQLAAELNGKPIMIPKDIAFDTQKYIGSEYSSWLSLQPDLALVSI